MPFKVVQTIEKGRSLLSAVPQDWESNGVLYWPKNFEKLRRVETSKPETNWKKINCILKRSNLQSFIQAELEIDNMTNGSDTETDIEYKRYQSRHYVKTKNTNKINFNELAKECCAELQPTNGGEDISSEKLITPDPLPPVFINYDISFSNNQSHTIIENINQESSEMMPQSLTEPHPEMSDQNLNQVFVTDAPLDIMALVLQKLDDIKQDIVTLSENQKKISFQLTETNIQFEKLIKISCTSKKNESNVSIMKPISNPKELQDFEHLLNDDNFKAKLKNQLDIYCSKGKKRGMSNAYSLIDVFFERGFLCESSWTGASKGENTKICLKSYRNILNLFFTIINESDPEFNKPECEKFFKTVLKNAQQRLQSKQTRTSTSRIRKQGDSVSGNPRNFSKENKSGVEELPVSPKAMEQSIEHKQYAPVEREGPCFSLQKEQESEPGSSKDSL